MPDKIQSQVQNNIDANMQDKDDSVVNDINHVKNFINSVKSKFIKTASPVINKVPVVTQQVSKVKPNMKKFKIIAGVVFFALVLLMIARVTMSLKKIRPEITPEVEEEAINIPTIPPFLSSDPSIYASDSEILKIEEDINVLKNEMNTTPLRESSILPPYLEYNINFK